MGAPKCGQSRRKMPHPGCSWVHRNYGAQEEQQLRKHPRDFSLLSQYIYPRGEFMTRVKAPPDILLLLLLFICDAVY